MKNRNSIFLRNYFCLKVKRIIRWANAFGFFYVIALLIIYFFLGLFTFLKLQKLPFYYVAALYSLIGYLLISRKTDIEFLQKNAPFSFSWLLLLEDNIMLLLLLSPWVIIYSGIKAFLLGHLLSFIFFFFRPRKQKALSFKFSLQWLPVHLFDSKKLIRTANFIFFFLLWLFGFFIASKGWSYVFYCIAYMFMLSGIIFTESEGKEIVFGNRKKWLYHFWKTNLLFYLGLFALQFPLLLFCDELSINDMFLIPLTCIGFVVIYLSLLIFYKYANYEQGRVSRDIIMPLILLIFAIAFPIGIAAILYYINQSIKQLQRHA